MLLSIYLPTLLLAFGRGLLLPIMPLYAGTFSDSYGLIGLVLAGEALGTLIADIPAGGLLRRLDRKWAMVSGVVLIAFSVLALAWASSIWLLFTYRLLAGVGGALWNLSRHAYLAEVTSRVGRGRAIALFGGTVRLGTFAGPAVGGLLAAALGLTAPFFLTALLAGLAAVAALLFVKPAAQPLPFGGVGGRSHPLARAVMDRYQVLLTAGFGHLLAQTIRAGRRVVIPLYGAAVLGLDVEAVGWILSVAAFLDMAMFYPAGLLMDRLGRKYAIVPSFVIQGLGMALVPLSGGFATLLLAASVMGLGNGLGSGTMMTLGADLAPSDSLGEFLGVWRLIGDGGAMGGPLVVGAVADLLGLPVAAAVIAVAGFWAAAVFAFRVPETLKPATPWRRP